MFTFEILKFECQEAVDDYNNDDTNGDTGEESVIERYENNLLTLVKLYRQKATEFTKLTLLPRALSPVSRDESDAIHRRLLSDQQRTDIHTTFVNPNRPVRDILN